ncbi:MAG TPA: DUF1501 domain-containing protein [Mycobacteriales bacterium]|nr:DUF1501 domain-containing protein [Mycobacteriales bacterium]
MSSDCPQCTNARATVTDLPPTQHIPLPEDVLDHGPEAVGLSRRSLLRAGTLGSVAVYGSSVLGLDTIFGSASAAAASGPSTCLVMLYLQGGSDGLGLVLPGSGATAQYNAYVTARPVLHRVQGASDNVAGTVGSHDIPRTGNTLAWSNPLLTAAAGGDNGGTYGFDTLWGTGTGDASSQLAVLPAVDYSPANLSHFDSSDYWFAGTLAGMSTGWLGRWIDNNGSATNPLQAVSIDNSLSKAIRTAVNPVCSIPATSAGKTPSLGFSMHTSGGYDMPHGGASTANINAQMTSFSQVAAGSGNAALARARSSYGQGVTVASQASAVNSLAATGPTYPADSLSNRLKLAARLLAAGLGTRVVTIHWGSFDTHGSQLQGQDPQLATLSQALGAFQADLIARGVEQNVVTMVFSEFGRRVAENDGGGTDHGAGGVVLMSGSAVKGGLCAPAASLTATDTYGNIVPTTDFRAVYRSVLQDWLGGDLTNVIPNEPAGGYTPGIARYDGGAATLFR